MDALGDPDVRDTGGRAPPVVDTDDPAVIDEHAQELLAEERVPFRSLDDALAQIRRQIVNVEEPRDERLRLVARQCVQRDRRRVRAAGPPSRPQLQELGPGDAEKEQRRILGALGETLDDLEDRRLGPLEIVDDDHGGRPRDGGQVLSGAPADLPAELRRHDFGHRVLRPHQAEHRREAGANGRSLGTEHRTDARVELPKRAIAIVRGGDARVLSHDLHERPIGDPGAVGQAAAAQYVCAVRTGDAGERLSDEPRLADARVAHDREDVSPAVVADALERFKEHPQLALPADELRAHRRQAAGLLGDRAAGPLRAERSDRVGLALGDDRIAAAVFDGGPRQRFGERADDDLAAVGRLLEPRRDVHGITRDKELAVLTRPGDGLAAVHADARRERYAELAVEVSHRVTHRERRADSAFGIVVVEQGHAEHDHHGIANELLDRAAVRFGDRLHAPEVRTHDRPDDLRIVVGAEGGRPDHIREDDGDELPLLRHYQRPRCTTSALGFVPMILMDGEGRSVGALCPIAIVPTALYSSGMRNAERNPAWSGTPKNTAPSPASTAVWRMRRPAIPASMSQYGTGQRVSSRSVQPLSGRA